MTRRRAVLAIGAAVLAVALLIGWPGPDAASRGRSPAGLRPTEPEEVGPRVKRRFVPSATTSVTELPSGETVPLDELRDDPNRVPGPDLNVRGFVYRSGRPVEGALVRLCRAYPSGRRPDPSPDPFVETRSLDDGSFALVAARRSRLVVEVRHEGSAVRRLVFVMPPVGDPKPARIDLAGGHGLEVRVIEPDGAPVSGVAVRVACAVGAAYPVAARWHNLSFAVGHGTAPPAVLCAVTDAEGRATFGGIEAGAVTIEAGTVCEYVLVPTGTEVVFVQEQPGIVEGVLRHGDGRAVPDVILCVETIGFRDRLGKAQGRTDAEGRFRIEGVPPGWVIKGQIEEQERVDGAPVLLRPGGHADWNPVVEPCVTVRGRTSTEDGNPLAAVRLVLTRDEETVAVSWSGDDGAFEFRAAEPGEYGLSAEAYGRQATVDVVTPGPPLTIPLLPCSRVVGRIQGLAEPALDRTSVRLTAKDFERTALVDAAGRFAFEHVPPLNGACVGSVVFDVPAAAVVRLDIDAHVRWQGEVVEADRWGRLIGEIRDHEGRPVAGAVVTFPDCGFIDMKLIQPAWANTTATDDEGRYELHPAPGWADRGKVGVAAACPGFAPESKCVQLPQSGEARRLDFTLWPAADLHGRMIDASGAPVRYAYVKAEPCEIEGYAVPESTHTSYDGAFRFTMLARGRYKVSAYENGLREPHVVEAETGETEVLITVSGESMIAGIVVGSGEASMDGLPLVATSSSGRFTTRTRDSGRFRFSGLPPGRYDVHIEDHAPVRDIPTGTDDLVLRLPR